MQRFPKLFSELSLGPTTLKNRIFIPAHGTKLLDEGGVIGDRFLAYHEARAAGGAAMIITEVHCIHPTYDPPNRMSVTSDDCIPGLMRLADIGKRHDCKILGQLFHPGRVIAGFSADGFQLASYAPSEVPDEVYKNIPSPLTTAQIWEIIEGFGQGGRRMAEAGLDGIEVPASMGYLLSQFLNPRINSRNDEFGGCFENRMRFVREVIKAIRGEVGRDIILGIRISVDEMDEEGLKPAETIDVLKALDSDGELDFFNIIAATTASYAGWSHVVPHMAMENACFTSLSEQISKQVSLPVLIAGRVNQPQQAEEIIAAGQADMVGLVRAHICDPEFTSKAKQGRVDDIRACIACNQACIGHGLKGIPISCIQFPESGRELSYLRKDKVRRLKRVIVVGGGPGGMKAAAVSAERGHDVHLYEKETGLGGQALLAQRLPDRAEFGGIVENLAHEMEIHGVTVHKGVEVTPELISAENPDEVILATGAMAQLPEVEGIEDIHAVDSWSVARGGANLGQSVVVWDWRCDWVGIGIAQMLAQDGHHVRLAVNGMVPGERIPPMVRDFAIGELHKLGVEITPYVRLFGADSETVYFQHVTSLQPVIMEGVDTLVSNHAPKRNGSLAEALIGTGIKPVLIGDCLSPRTAEEAVLEGLKAAMAV